MSTIYGYDENGNVIIISPLPSNFLLYMGLILVVFINMFAKTAIKWFPLVTLFCVIVCGFYGYCSYKRFVYSGVSRLVSICSTLISECSFLLFLLLCIRDVLLVAQDGILGAVAAIFSSCIAALVVIIARLPYYWGVDVQGNTGAAINGLLTPTVVAILCYYFDFFDAIPGLIKMIFGQ